MTYKVRPQCSTSNPEGEVFLFVSELFNFRTPDSQYGSVSSSRSWLLLCRYGREQPFEIFAERRAVANGLKDLVIAAVLQQSPTLPARDGRDPEIGQVRQELLRPT